LGNDWYALEVDDRAGRVADAVGRRFSDPRRGREAQNLFSATLLLLAQDGLSAETAYRATARALDARPETTPRAERDRVTLLAGPRAKASELRGLVQSVLPWIARSDAAEQALEQAERRAASERDHRLELDATLADRDRQIAELTREMASLGERIKGLEEDLRSHAVHGSHDLDQVRSGARAFLDSRLRDLLDTAHEALELDPPRPHIAKEKLEIAREAIEEQVRWLTR
jgi:phage-related minor tail protein